ncbi:MAG: hypothetical protein CMJ58_16880 [Planctomycetaceae bacterium]|nr:hypothetical protein [Planctomycetaceae bacterium]
MSKYVEELLRDFFETRSHVFNELEHWSRLCKQFGDWIEEGKQLRASMIRQSATIDEALEHWTKVVERLREMPVDVDDDDGWLIDPDWWKS